MRWLRRWLDLSLGSKCLLLISLPAAVTVAMAAAAYLAGTGTVAAGEQLNARLRIGNAVERLGATEIEMSAQSRAYLITGDESFAGKTREAMAAFDSAWQNLSDLTPDDSFQKQRLAQVAALERSRVERIFEDTPHFQSHARPWGQLAAALRGAEAERSEIERILKSIEAGNARAMEAYLARANELRSRQNAILAVSLFLGIAGGAAMTMLFARGITSRIGRLQRNIAQLATGSRIDALPGRDEIGTLSEGLLQIARVISQQREALESALDGIAEVDGQGRYRWLNKAYAEIAGLTEAVPPPPSRPPCRWRTGPRLKKRFGSCISAAGLQWARGLLHPADRPPKWR